MEGSIGGPLMPESTSERQEMLLVGVFGGLELVLYGIREVAEQLYETLDQ